MALSPNYLWSEPDNSSLVKNGAADIRTLGNAIDTSVWNVGFGQAGKNKIINGDFSINQRGFSSTTTTTTFGFDRWQFITQGGTVTYSAQTFTAGAAPVAGYESTNFARIVSTGQSATSDRSILTQKMENVRTFAGQSVTVSFWAKAATGTPSVAAEFSQVFGTGGSSPVNVTGQKTAITTSWARYSLNFTIPSISGKTISSTDSIFQLRLYTSAGSDYNSQTASLGLQSNTIDFWGVQVEAGSTATPFQTASGGSLQGELAMCQRYYFRNAATNNSASFFMSTFNTSTTGWYGVYTLPVTMRTKPTVETSGTASHYRIYSAAGFTTLSTVPALDQANESTVSLSSSVASGLTAGQGSVLAANGTSLAYLGFTAEL